MRKIIIKWTEMRSPECCVFTLRDSENMNWKTMTTLMLILRQEEGQTIVLKDLTQEDVKRVLAINWDHQGDNVGEIFQLVKDGIFHKLLHYRKLLR